MPASATIALNNDFPVPLEVFLSKIARTQDEIWGGLLKADHGREKHTELQWAKILNSKRNRRT